MNKIIALIVDDEAHNRSALRNLLLKYCPDVMPVAEAADAAEALRQIAIHHPELVFMDINMPGQNGFDILNAAGEYSFHVIFVTAYDSYAVAAFKHNAVDYLMKPVNIDELTEAVDKVKTQIKLRNSIQDFSSLIASVQQIKKADQKINLPVSDGFVFVKIHDIIRCEAEGNYTVFYFANHSKLTICRTLGEYETLLKEHDFIRIHHHHLINMEYVERYQRGRGGVVIMADQKAIDVSQRKKNDFLNMLEHKKG
ncbi:LytR/AlgR family response regulator transcription factor [Chitinophagaceae bacterium MMS25-I14]